MPRTPSRVVPRMRKFSGTRCPALKLPCLYMVVASAKSLANSAVGFHSDLFIAFCSQRETEKTADKAGDKADDAARDAKGSAQDAKKDVKRNL